MIKNTDVIVLDFRQVFDEVPHHHLCPKLSYCGNPGGILSWIENFLTGRSQQVIVNGCTNNPYSGNSSCATTVPLLH